MRSPCWNIANGTMRNPCSAGQGPSGRPPCICSWESLLIGAYNLIIVSSRFFAAYDPVYRLDSWLLQGSSVSAIVHWADRTFPLAVFQFLEFVYFSLFAEIGACLILT